MEKCLVSEVRKHKQLSKDEKSVLLKWIKRKHQIYTSLKKKCIADEVIK